MCPGAYDLFQQRPQRLSRCCRNSIYNAFCAPYYSVHVFEWGIRVCRMSRPTWRALLSSVCKFPMGTRGDPVQSLASRRRLYTVDRLSSTIVIYGDSSKGDHVRSMLNSKTSRLVHGWELSFGGNGETACDGWMVYEPTVLMGLSPG